MSQFPVSLLLRWKGKLPRGKAIKVLSEIYTIYKKLAVLETLLFFAPRYSLEEFIRSNPYPVLFHFCSKFSGVPGVVVEKLPEIGSVILMNGMYKFVQNDIVNQVRGQLH